MPGLHSSGRNSGVLHCGIYYPPDSLKAKLCREGSLEMAEYHKDNRLRLDQRGKVLVTTRIDDGPQLELLAQRAKLNGVQAEVIDAHGLKEIESEARSMTGIRAQMLDKQIGRLVTDFLVERGPSSTHILNAISPAWTSAFPFARYICDNFIERTQ